MIIEALALLHANIIIFAETYKNGERLRVKGERRAVGNFSCHSESVALTGRADGGNLLPRAMPWTDICCPFGAMTQ